MLTHAQQLAILTDRWASRPGPFAASHGEVVRELQEVAVADPVTMDDLHRYADVFVDVLGTTHPSVQAQTPSLGPHIATCRFGFGEGSQDIALADVGAAFAGPLMRFWGPSLLVAKPARRYQWLRAAAILDADEVFGRLMEMGF